MGTYGCVAVVVNQTFNAAGLLFEYTQSATNRTISAFRTFATRKSDDCLLVFPVTTVSTLFAKPGGYVK